MPKEDWRSERKAEVTVGPAMVLLDGALLGISQLDRLFSDLESMPLKVREDRQRALDAIISVGRELGLPAEELEALRAFERQRMLQVAPSTVRDEHHRIRRRAVWPDR